ncbi:MAG: putative secreted protein [Myxococcales bacterium]|nr:putative secreted protein [Myxococcales bacterium]
MSRAFLRSVLPRRTVLRGMVAGGIAVTLPLPRMAGMLDGNGNAYAGGAALPKRYGTWFFGNGINPPEWVPTTTGAGNAWTLSPPLMPLQPVKSYLQVITGLTNKIPPDPAHKGRPAAALTGANAGGADVQLPSIDQLLVPILNAGSMPALPNGLHVGISNTSGAGALDLRVSFRGPNASNPPEYDPANVFKQLVMYNKGGTTTGGGTPTGPDPELAHRKRVLDAVLDSAASLRARLGKADQIRLDQHLDGVHQIENQIAILSAMKPTPSMSTSAKLVDPAVAYPNMGAVGSITALRSKAMSDLIVFALATDLTRVFSFMFTCSACHGNYADAGLDPVTFHEDYGHRKSPKGLAYATQGFSAGVKYAMTNFSYTLTAMMNCADGAGNLLDNSVVYSTSCTSESTTHSGNDYPTLVAGKAGGLLKGDQHLRFASGPPGTTGAPNGDNQSKVPYTLLTALGRPPGPWGMGDSQVSTGLSDLLV